MTWLRSQIAPTPHVLNTKDTQKAAAQYARGMTIADLSRMVADHRRALEHEHAVLAGLEDTLSERLSA